MIISIEIGIEKDNHTGAGVRVGTGPALTLVQITRVAVVWALVRMMKEDLLS